MDDLNHATLKDKQRAIRDGFPPSVGLRVHRAISWIGRAESCCGGADADEDADGRFIFLWIAFNAAYADERGFHVKELSERETFGAYFDRLIRLDVERRIYDALWRRFPGPVRILMNNHFTFAPFWQHHNGIAGADDWRDRFNASTRRFNLAFQHSEAVSVLTSVFDRLYVLRNQLVHGGSTWNSKVNRGQVRDGAGILGFLMPVFVDIMMDNPDEDWGQPFYPVVDE